MNMSEKWEEKLTSHQLPGLTEAEKDSCWQEYQSLKQHGRLTRWMVPVGVAAALFVGVWFFQLRENVKPVASVMVAEIDEELAAWDELLAEYTPTFEDLPPLGSEGEEGILSEAPQAAQA